jgi:hypothetical protein
MQSKIVIEIKTEKMCEETEKKFHEACYEVLEEVITEDDNSFQDKVKAKINTRKDFEEIGNILISISEGK